jgi:hypothetical protein
MAIANFCGYIYFKTKKIGPPEEIWPPSKGENSKCLKGRVYGIQKLCLETTIPTKQMKYNPTSWGQDINQTVPKIASQTKPPNIDTIWLIPRPHEVRLFFHLLCWNF